MVCHAQLNIEAVGVVDALGQSPIRPAPLLKLLVVAAGGRKGGVERR